MESGGKSADIAPGEHLYLNAYPEETKSLTIAPIIFPDVSDKYVEPSIHARFSDTGGRWLQES